MNIISPETDEEFKQYYNLRWRLLRKPWDEPEGSEQDETDNKGLEYCYHIAAVEKHIIIAVARLEFSDKQVAQLRYMAVDDFYQNKGIGSEIIKHAEQYARQKNTQQLYLNARENAVHFYQKSGYKIIEKSYLLFGVIQHYKMIKYL